MLFSMKIPKKKGVMYWYNLLLYLYINYLYLLQASEELEDRQSLAVMAASGQDEVTGPDGETFIEKYTRGVSAVETILTLDRLRQSVAVKELINAKSKHLLPMGGSGGTAAQVNNSPFMRKTVSVPNISHVSFRWIAPLRSNTNVAVLLIG